MLKKGNPPDEKCEDCMTNVGVLGAGAWGTAIGKCLVENGHSVQLWSFEEDVADEINKFNANSRYLIGVNLPEQLTASNDILEVATGKDFLLITMPSPFVLNGVRGILSARDIIEGKTYIAVLSKGFVETASGAKLIVEAVEDYLPGIYKGNLAYISGPSHAEEVARGKLTGLIAASKNGKNAIRFRELLSSQKLIVFSSLDITGVQISAAMKNVVALAFGMLDALSEFSDHIGDNTESLLLAAGINEIQQLGTAMGASHPETFASIAGVGDLDVTCRSRYGRNRRFGREIIIDRLLDKYSGIDDIFEHMSDVGYFAEGVVAAKHVFDLAEEYNLALPICRGVYGILDKQLRPAEAIETILSQLGREIPR
jgi:glycerol-3-phosphate dehydrogenase (NAD(P)+)